MQHIISFIFKNSNKFDHLRA